MANASAVCLLCVSLFCFANLSLARQTPKECSKGPEYWCQNLRKAADCGAVGHCIGSVWETQKSTLTENPVSNKFVRLFRQLKDVKDLINEEYLSIRVSSACKDVKYPTVAGICKQNTAKLEKYLMHVLASETTPETMCLVVGMCNNPKLDSALKKKKTTVHKEHLLGSEKCVWGPSYWCSNISTSHDCKATHHCVERVWSKMTVVNDNDTICNICKDMVEQARDQLTSNQTQEDLKAVFEGSCKLIPIKVVAKECIKLADDFVPDLVETLSSQMNPSIVCSVAGLCNNANIDRLLENYNAQVKLRAGCTNCHKTVGVIRKKFDATSYEDFLAGLLRTCGRFGSLSDSCSMLVFKYYENILAALKKDLAPQSICHLNGECSFMFHSHDLYTFPEEDALAAVDDVPCELCEQMVKHLRDVLVANTTEFEFYKVMKGLCKQTGGFKSECLHLVDEYYSEIYNYLVNELNATTICSMIGICGKVENVPVAPLLPSELIVKAITVSPKLIGADEANSYKTDMPKQTNVQIMPEEGVAPLPIDRMFVALPENKAACSFCQYFLHYLQVELSDVNTEEVITHAVEEACDRLPQAVNSQCKQFVTEYGPAVIALLVQEIDPASVCPALKICPETQEVRHVAINSEKSSCPLCLFAIEQLETMLENNRTQANIRNALDKLCNHLSQKLRSECIDFVDTYSKQIVNMLINNTQAQEVCVYLGLCKDEVADPLRLQSSIDKYHDKPQLRGDRNNFRRTPLLPKHKLETGDGDIAHKSADVSKEECHVCKIVLKEIAREIKEHGEGAVKKAVHGICKKIPHLIRSKCDKFVDKYSDRIIDLLVQNIKPDEVCHKLMLCKSKELPVSKTYKFPDISKEECRFCKIVLEEIAREIKVRGGDAIKKVVHGICKKMPSSMRSKCDKFVDKYSDRIIGLLVQGINPDEICHKIWLCKSHEVPVPKKTNEIPDHTANGRPVKMAGAPDTACVICEFVMKEIDDQIKDKHNDDEIKKAVHGVCKHMPKSVRAQCDQFVEKYADLVISLLAQELDPSEVCQELKLCKPSAETVVAIKEDILNCAVCETVVMAVKKVLANDKVDRNVVHIVEKSCALLPAKYYARCHTLMEIYGDSIIHLIEDIGTKGVCAKIGLCSDRSAAFVHMDTEKGH